MKQSKFLKITFVLLLFSFAFSSCHKEYVTLEEKQSPIELAKKVDNWLDKQKIGATDTASTNTIQINSIRNNTAGKNGSHANKNANIDLLKDNLDFNSATTQTHNQICDLLVIPIKDDLKSAKNLDKSSSLNLLLTMDKSANIISANIVYFLPADKKKHNGFSSQTIHNIMNNKPVHENGMFKFMDVTGTWKYQMEYKNDTLKSIGVIKTKDNGNVKTSSTCIDWYLVTTYHYADGSSYTTEEYEGSTCGDDCDDPMYMSICGSDSGGGGGASEEVTDSKIIISRDLDDDQGPDDPSTAGPAGNFSYFYPIKYEYGAYINYFTLMGYTVVRSVDMYNITADPIESNFSDINGDPGKRKLTLLGHYNWSVRLVPPLALLSWSCFINAQYQYFYLPSKSLQWGKSKMEVD